MLRNISLFQAPRFWWKEEKPSVLANLGLTSLEGLYQLGCSLYRYGGKQKIAAQRASCPVISVGSLLVGGSGKTPITLALIEMLQKKGLLPMVVTRGYGGSGGVLRVLSNTKAEVAGDEALLLAKEAPTYVARERKDALLLLKSFITERSVILLDDAHQHHSLKKDISFIVLNQQQKLGNGRLFPAGPLRESLVDGLCRADAIFWIGSTEEPSQAEFLRSLRKIKELPIFSVETKLSCSLPLNTPVVAFAGIGFPQQFSHALTEDLGLQIQKFISFPDHWFYTPKDEARLYKLTAQCGGAMLVTTAKDAVKLSPGFRAQVHVVTQKCSFPNALGVEQLILRWVREWQK